MVPNRFTVVLDTNVLYGALHRNVILSLAAGGLLRPRWSQRTLSELSLRLADRIGEEQSEKQVARIQEAFPEGSILVSTSVESSLELPDADDKHVLAAAIQAKAAQIATDNVKDFPPANVAPHDIEVVTADHLIAHTVALAPTRAVASIRRMRKRLNKPSFDAEQLLLKLESHGLPEAASELSEYADLL
ncbi:MAG: PIN domain-containing protein [Pseudomonadota bacterium]